MILRTMTCQELGTILEWAAAEGWNPGTGDAPAFHAADPEGFFVSEVDGALAAAISVVNHSDSFAFLGLYICHPDHRGQGIGLALWQHALQHAGDRTIGLDGVPAQQENYRRSGFRPAAETSRFEGALAAAPDDRLRPAATSEIPELIDLANASAGYAMDVFLSGWLADTDGRHTLVLESDGRIAGFATCRRCLRGSKIGPLVADTQETAEALLHAISAQIPGEYFVIDIPNDMTALAEHCRTIGMACSFSTARMYRGTPPTAATGIRTIATLELG